jgi:hypothetical protein
MSVHTAQIDDLGCRSGATRASSAARLKSFAATAASSSATAASAGAPCVTAAWQSDLFCATRHGTEVGPDSSSVNAERLGHRPPLAESDNCAVDDAPGLDGSPLCAEASASHLAPLAAHPNASLMCLPACADCHDSRPSCAVRAFCCLERHHLVRGRLCTTFAVLHSRT